MPAFAYLAASVPASIITVALVLRHGPSAVITLIAGLVAVLGGERRADRAVAVLRLLRTTPARRTRRGPGPTRRV